jgi:hypothetical protein
MKMTKQEQFALLSEKLTRVINDELFLTSDQKQELNDEVFCINQRVQSGLMKGVEIRLCAVRNTLLTWRSENLFPSLKK